MDEEAELQARIAAISGKINNKKQQSRHPPPAYQGGPRWTPYGQHPRPGYLAPHRNRTLDNRKILPTTPAPNTGLLVEPISNAHVHEVQAKKLADTNGMKPLLLEAIERHEDHGIGHVVGSRIEKSRKQTQKEPKAPRRRAAEAPAGQEREIEVEGIRFRLSDGASKLVRVSNADSTEKETPKRAVVSGVTFLRSKHGNLIRLNTRTGHDRTTNRPQCQHFTKHGNCPFGPRCKFAHDPEKVAVCKEFLSTGSCSLGTHCDLSHELTYHRVSACTHFLRGNCTNNPCRYPHVRVSPAARVCRAFATLGYCAKGPDCDKRHVLECPDYANKGVCADRENGKCQLPHPDRASTLRKAAERQAKIASGTDSDLSSDEEDDEEEDQDTDTIESDADEDIVMTAPAERTHELTQQQDFVAFS